jgi:ABC-type phosphate/phosphonate transport system substrate-binding protein
MASVWRRGSGLILGLAGILVGTAAEADLVFSAPPRETRAVGQALYGPLAEYLSKVSGQKVDYQYPDNWGAYQALMTKGQYDLVFDGPHFVSWRIARLQHVPLVALVGRLNFVVVARANDAHVHTLADLSGKGVCVHAPPNLATLTLLDQFPNQARQPRLIDIKGFKRAFDDLVAGTCSGTVLPVEVYKKFDPDSRRSRVLHTSPPLPNQALTAGPRVDAAMRSRLVQALLSAEGQVSLRPIAEDLGAQGFSAARAEEYRGLDGLLKNTWGFEPPAR